MPRPTRGVLSSGLLLGALCAAFLAVAAPVAIAGDILRGGGSAAGATGSSGGAAAAPPGTTAPVNLVAGDILRRTTAALQAVQNMQAAARAAASAANAANNLGLNPRNSAQPLPDVPDGLNAPDSTGPGLSVAYTNGAPTLWVGATAPTQQTSTGTSVPAQVTVTITQQQQQAYLQWQTFDVGRNTSLVFDQSGGGSSAANWIAFNFVRDPSGRPSQILGDISTVNNSQGSPQVGGQVYVMDANGIIFGGSSQVNAGALVASSLPINTNLIQRGLLNNPDEQFLFSALPLAPGNNGPTPAFTPSAAVAGVAPAQTPFDPAGSGQVADSKGSPYAYGDVIALAGAELTAPSTNFVGGKVALVGPNVTNQGTITTPDGQTILAAGLQVGLAAHNTSDATLRGLDVYVGEVADKTLPNQPAAGTATNDIDAWIEAPRADTTVTGSAVNQLGAVDSSTSVSYDGRVDLLASYGSLSGGGFSTAPFFPQKTGTVTLGDGSLTQILPELGSTDTIAETSLALPSTINILGGSVDFAGNAATGALLLAPSGTVAVEAGTWQFVSGGLSGTGVAASSVANLTFNGGTIAMADNSAIDVSGSENVSASVQENIVAVQLLGPQLADSPVQRTGPLRGQTIYVDVLDKGTYNGQPWVGTPLADTSGYVGLIPHTVGELTANGGNVSLQAGAAVNLDQGSTVDVAGGWIDYAGGTVQTTKLLYQGQVIDISQATPNLVYQGIYTGNNSATDSKWNVTSTTSNPLPLGTYIPTYVQGGNGGALAISAGSVALSGTMFGQTYAGLNQRQPFIPYSSPSLQNVANANIDPRVWELNSAPEGSSLTLTLQEQYALGSDNFPYYSPSPPDVFFQPVTAAAPTDPNALVLSPALTDPNGTTYGGFGSLKVDDSATNEQLNSNGQLVEPAAPSAQTITIPVGVALQTPPGGSVTLAAPNITLDGSIVAPGGTVSVTASDFWANSPYLSSGAGSFGPPAYNPLRGNLEVGPQSVISAAGLVADDRAGANGANPLITAGGTVSLLGSNVTVASGAVLSADGGAEIGPTAKVTYGAGGSITLEAGEDEALASSSEILGGTLTFDVGDQLAMAPASVPLQAYSGSAGGKLTIESSLIQVGTTPGTPTPPGTLLLPSAGTADGGYQSFFNAGGFSNFDLIGLGYETDPTKGGAPLVDSQGHIVSVTAVNVASGAQADPTLIHPRVDLLQITPGAAGESQTQILQPQTYQNTPATLTFSAPGVTDSSRNQTLFGALVVRGDTVVGAGAVIETDPQTNGAGGVTLSGNTVTVLGTVIAPGGTISVKGGSKSEALFASEQQGLPTVDLGPESELSTAGETLLTSDYLGRVPGEAGYIITGSVLPGGTINVSGNIVTESDAANPNAVIDVSGWSDTRDAWGLLEFAPQFSGAAPSTAGLLPGLVPTVVSSNGGTVTLTAGEALFPDKSMVGTAGASNAAGGSLTVSGQTFGALPGSTDFFDTLLVTAGGPTIPGSFYPSGQTAIGHAVLGTNGTPMAGLGLATLPASSFSSGGFDSLNLYGAVFFQGTGPIDLAAKGELTIGGNAATYPGSGYLSASTGVTLSAAVVNVGQSYLAPVLPVDEPVIFPEGQLFPVTSGGGSLSITAGSAASPGLINLGNLALQNISSATFTSVAGDVQGYGTVDIAGDLTVAADLVYPSTAETLSIDAYGFTPKNGTLQPGAVTFEPSPAAADRPVPLSAGGTLSVYASVINQNGVLRAPLGTINLGWDGTGAAPATDRITGGPVASTQTLSLGTGSVTSVSGNSAGVASGPGLPIPYGINLNGTSWIDPTGTDITGGGPPSKMINLDGVNVAIATGASVDASGGGDLYAYQFVPGTGGENDILNSASGSFAVFPGYASSYAPNAAFNPNKNGLSSNATNLLYPDQGYTSSGLALGEQVRIDLGNGMGLQTYTLLPARYALLPGAYLVTPIATSAIPPSQPVIQPDGSYVSAGYVFNAYDPSQSLYSEFSVAAGTAGAGSGAATPAPATVVRSRAQYTDYLANTFFNAASSTATPAAAAATIPVPLDGGQLAIAATGSLTLQGSVDAAAAAGGQGGIVDFSSSGSEAIVINDTGTAPASGSSSNTLFLSAHELSDFGAGSLLIGGTLSGSTVTVTAPSVEVSNDHNAALEGSDITLVANQNLTVDSGAVIEATGSPGAPPPSLQIADSIQLTPAATLLAAGAASKLTLARSGAAVSFSQKVPTGDTLTASSAGTVTSATGVVTTFAKGATFTSASTTLSAGSTLSFSGTGGGTLTLTGSSGALPLTIGDGTLLRVSAGAAASSSRIAVASSTAPTLSVGDNATLSGASVVLDSTNLATVSSTAVLSGGVSLSSGQISLVLDPALIASATSASPSSLILSGAALAGLQTNATSLSLSSYSSIDTYGSGTVGSPSYAGLALHSGEIRGFDAATESQTVGVTNSGTSVTFEAKAITLDDDLGGTGPGPVSKAMGAGTLAFDATGGAITLGANATDIDQFENVSLAATGGVLAQGTSAAPGTLAVAGNLTLTAPVIVGAVGAVQTIMATGGQLSVQPDLGVKATVAGGIGAALTFEGSNVVINGDVLAPSGELNVVANGAAGASGAVMIGGSLDAGGTSQAFNASTSYTNGGQIDLSSANGNVALAAGGYLSVAAPAGGGNAGGVSISAPGGTFTVAASTSAQNGATLPSLNAGAPLGAGGTFALDVSTLSDAGGNTTSSLSPIEGTLDAGNFALSQSIRVRTGNVTVDGAVAAHTFGLSADAPASAGGNIEVTSGGFIDASGPTGGAIEIDAGGSVTLDNGSQLSVKGENFNDAGQGGSVTLQAGSYVDSSSKAPSDLRNSATGMFTGGGAVDIGAGSRIDLSVVNDHALELNPGGASAATPAGSITVPAGVGVYFPAGTPGNDEIMSTTGGTVTLANGSQQALAAGVAVPLASGSTVTLPAGGTLAYSGGSGGSIPVDVPMLLSGGGALTPSTVNVTDLGALNETGTLSLVAPQVFNPKVTNPLVTGGTPVDVRIDPILGTVVGASGISVVGVDVFDLTPKASPGKSAPTFATIDATVENDVQQDGALFAGGYTLDNMGNTVAVAGNSTSISAAVSGGNATLGGLLHVRPGAEIVNTTGDLDLDSTWDFAETALYTTSAKVPVTTTVMLYRFGPTNSEPGNLTLRAAGNIALGQAVDPNSGESTFGSLSDGFNAFDGSDNSSLIQAALLPTGSLSWSFRLVAGADVRAADTSRVLPLATLAAARSGQGAGSILLGQGSANLAAFGSNDPSDFFQTIRTGTGSIGLYSGVDVRLEDNLFSVYTAGTQVDPLAEFVAGSSDTTAPQFATGGGDVTVVAQGSIEHVNAQGQPDSSKELPLNWLDRQGSVNLSTGQFALGASTSWWVDYTSFYEGVGALGGGNVTLTAGGDISNVYAAVPTNEQTTFQTTVATSGGSGVDTLAADQSTLELGGGDLEVRAGGDLSGGVYYVERGQGALQAGGIIETNATRAAISPVLASARPVLLTNPESWLPTTLFLGDGDFSVQAGGNVLLGPVVNPFLLPAPRGSGGTFSTYSIDDSISVSSLTGSVTVKDDPDGDTGGGGGGSIGDWLGQISAVGSTIQTFGSALQPWIGLNGAQLSNYNTLVGIMPSSLYATAFTGDVDLAGGFELSPAPSGQLSVQAAGSVNGFQPNSANTSTGLTQWGSAVINLSDANPAAIPGLANPLAPTTSAFLNVNGLFAESGSVTGAFAVLQTQQELHSPGLLHAGDPDPLVIDASSGNISGLTLYSAKSARVSAGADITDIGFYVQNDKPGDITTVTAGGDIIPYDPSSPLRSEVTSTKQVFLNGGSQAAAPGTGNPDSGDIQIAGPGTLEVLAGGNINLGETVGAAPGNGTSVGVTSIGNSANPYLPFQGSNVVMAAGVAGLGSLANASPGLADSRVDFADFISDYLNPSTAPANGARYLPELADMLGVAVPAGSTPDETWAMLQALPSSSSAELNDKLALDAFLLVLRDAGRDHNDPTSPNFGAYTAADSAIATLFPGSTTKSGGAVGSPSIDSITLATRLVETTNGGDIAMLAPNGFVTVGRSSDPQKVAQGILTESGGNISIYAQNDVEVGTSRIFTLHGGDEIIWSLLGDIAAGSGSKTVHAAPPTRVLINPQSADVQNDLAGLATGSGIGVLATLVGVPPGNVDLIAPVGTIDAGDAGIRASGNVNVAALHIVNATNIQASGSTSGVPAVAAPNIGGLTSASSATAASSSAASSVAAGQQNATQTQVAEIPSLIDVEVLGYGGGDDFPS